MDQKQLPLIGGAVSFDGAVSLEVTDEFVRPWRLPVSDLDLFAPVLVDRASNAAGTRITTISDTSSIEIDLLPLDELDSDQTRTVDLLVDGVQHARLTQSVRERTFRFDDLPEGEHRLELYPPQRKGKVSLTAVRIDAKASARRFIDHRPKWVVYGSSITQCAQAQGPSEIWPVLVANAYDLNLTCMGFGGNCHLEAMVGRVIRDLPADLVTMCLGINVKNGSTLGPRTFPWAVVALVELVREKHPEIPIGLVSPIFSSRGETTENAVGLTLEKMREIIRDVVGLLQKRGDQNLSYTHGHEVFGPELAEHLPDDLHPNARGYALLAENYAKVVMPKLGLAQQRPVRAALLDEADAAV